jgi:DNA polymerase III delta subunit
MVRDYVTKDEMDSAFKTTLLSRQPGSLHNTLSQATTNMDSNQYKRVLELMLELERKMESRFDDMQMDVRREVQRVGDER